VSEPTGRAGTLVLVATPIGNLGDLSPRAAAALAGADLVACEDTRRTGRLFELAGLARRPLVRLDDHTEVARTTEIVDRVLAGARVAVVTDAGTPGIADPGERLVRAAAAAGCTIEVVPGPSAVLTALVGSGLPAARFCFEGFLPRRAGERARRLTQLRDEARTMVFYESPHRLAATLADLAAAFGPGRDVVVARELTKLHEQWWRGPAGEAAGWAAGAAVRGELVVVVAGAPDEPPPDATTIERAVAEALAAGSSVRAAATDVAARLGVGRREVYDVALQLAGRASGGGPDRGGRPRGGEGHDLPLR